MAQNQSENQKDTNTASSSGHTRKTSLIIFLIIILIICFFCFVCFGSFYFLASFDLSSSAISENQNFEYRVVRGSSLTEDALVSIPIGGIILTNQQTDMPGIDLFGSSRYTFGYSIKNQFIRISEDSDIKGVILEINSPGGTVTGANAIVDGIEYYREQTGNPVVAHCSGMCASGSYLIAAAADYVISDSGSMIGSIGVINGPFVYYDEVIQEGSALTGSVLTQDGIEHKYFTGGEHKDFGNPYRRLTPEEIDTMQENVNNEYDTFVNQISEFRKLSSRELKNNIKSLVYGNIQAKNLKLIDKIGNREDAYEYLANQAGIDDESYKILQEFRPVSFLGGLLMNTEIENSTEVAVKANQGNSSSIKSRLSQQTLMLYGGLDSVL